MMMPHALLHALAALSPVSLAATAVLARLLRRRRRTAEARSAELERRITRLEHDRTRLEHDRADLERTSVTDPLTGVWNYRYLQLSLEREVARGLRTVRPLSVLLLRVDGFAALRHQAGHQHANAVLRDLAQRLAVEIRQTDTFGRYGGEEFLVLLPETGAAGAAQVSERLCWTVRRYAPRPGIPAGHRLTASVGAAVLPGDGEHAAVLLRAADRALAAASDAGGDAWRRVPGGGEAKPREAAEQRSDAPPSRGQLPGPPPGTAAFDARRGRRGLRAGDTAADADAAAAPRSAAAPAAQAAADPAAHAPAHVGNPSAGAAASTARTGRPAPAGPTAPPVRRPEAAASGRGPGPDEAA